MRDEIGPGADNGDPQNPMSRAYDPCDGVDTSNDYMVGSAGRNQARIMRPPLGPIHKDEAFRLAAWLVALTEEDEGEFEQVLEAVRYT